MPDALSVGIAAFVLVLAAGSVRVVRAFAEKRALLDLPNERSSHKTPVPRLGGAAFAPWVIVAVALLWRDSVIPLSLRLAFFAGVTAMYAISLLDDFVSLSTGVRFAVQFAASAGAVLAAPTGLLVPAVPVILVQLTLVLGIIGVANIYNFMDGIDGIAGLQGVIAGGAWFLIGSAYGALGAAMLGACLAAGALGFLTVNWPPAKIFMGDAGSTVLGYSFAVLPLLALAETGQSERALKWLSLAALVLWPFLADGAFTLLRRLQSGENIFQAHRSHLYQRLVIAGWPHRTITLVYGSLAAVGATLGAWVMSGATGAIWGSGAAVCMLFVTLWRWTVHSERRAAASRLVAPRESMRS